MADLPSKIRLPTKSPFPKIVTLGQKWAPHEDLYHRVLTSSWTEFFLLIACAYVGANVLFAFAFMAQQGSISNARAGSIQDAFFFSVQTMATIGYGTMAPATLYAHIVVTIEAFCGILGVALITGITFSKFARPTARVLFTKNPVVTVRDGVPHLMFRIANWRNNLVVEARLRVTLLVTETTMEGDTIRRPLELALVRDSTPMFTLTWTAMHRIDETSPFYGPDAMDRLRARGGELYLSLQGTDETFSQTIHARHAYKLDDITWNARFVDVLTLLPDGTRQLDYRKFHQVEAVDAPRPVPPG
ncbi:MAG: ion channel [Polyangiales bacterium]